MAKVIVLADGLMGLKITKFLLDNFYDDIVMVITTIENEISNLAESLRVPNHVFRSTSQLIDSLPERCEIGILAWWPKIIEKELIHFPSQGFYNTHPSYLPYGKGRYPNFFALVEKTPFGVTVHKVDEGVDTGPIVERREIAYSWLDTGETLYTRATEAIFEIFKSTYPRIREGNLILIPNDPKSGTQHHSSELETASKILLDQNYLARDLLNLIRARTFDGFPGCWFTEDNVKYEVRINIKRVEL